ncbi:LPS export ABC transporter permease LptG [Catenovulum maritimum]|uniref:Lipopolysaccharide ABC transporter permease n=1 Tax=Catenovulum maritimum TaxID=1513271 RepID=A0A0J8GUE6_9ALTE|nr:LPS export ABC transporter permease LptG [Catenovulum maritimum]KMT66400.1 lipopolysaccharide ABC transporter permease [Catenovulum maritimum]
MFKLVDLYIGKAIAASTFFSVLMLTALSGLIRFVEQLRYIGRGTYTMSDASMFVLYSMPRDLEVFFPMAALLGGLIGLGALASNSELIVLQAAGMSRLKIIKSVMKTTTVLVVIVLIIGEYFAPKLEQLGDELRNGAIYGSQQETSAKQIWLKDIGKFVHVGDAKHPEKLSDVTIYDFDKSLNLTKVVSAQSAEFQQSDWLLKNVEETLISPDKIEKITFNEQVWQTKLTPDKLTIVAATPEALSITELSDYLDYLKTNEQESGRYQLAFWRKILQPITVAVMMLMALSFIFGPLRSTSMGTRILMGVMTGFGFFISNRIFGPVVLVYEFPPVLGALLPSLLFTLIAINMIKRQR